MRYEKMADWIHDEIEKVASRPLDQQVSESYELHKHGLTITASLAENSVGGNGNQGQRHVRLLPNRVIKTVPTATNSAKSGPIEDTAVDADEGEEEEVPTHLPKGGPTPGPHPTPGPKNDVRPQQRVSQPTQHFDLAPIFTPVSGPYGNISPHSLRLSLLYPDQPQDLEVEVRPVGEDGSRPLLGLMEVVVGTMPARIFSDKQSFLFPAATDSTKPRQTIAVRFNQPILNRSFVVRAYPCESEDG